MSGSIPHSRMSCPPPRVYCSPSSSSSVKGFTGVRFSLYPSSKPTKNDEGEPSSFASSSSDSILVENAIRDLTNLGLEVQSDNVSTLLLGPEPTLFEGVRVAFGRAAAVANHAAVDQNSTCPITRIDDRNGETTTTRSSTNGRKEVRQKDVSMQCTFSAGCPGEPDESPLPPRSAAISSSSWINEAYNLPTHVTCQYAVYPLGSSNYMQIIYDVIHEAKKSPVFAHGSKTHFCTMLQGDGNEVFNVLQSSFALARERNRVKVGGGGHVTMTATITTKREEEE